MSVLRAIGLFLLAGLAEIGGGYLMWRWLRSDAAWWIGGLGGLILVGYGVIPTLQRDASFGRIYAAYGGVFVVASRIEFQVDEPILYRVIEFGMPSG